MFSHFIYTLCPIEIRVLILQVHFSLKTHNQQCLTHFVLAKNKTLGSAEDNFICSQPLPLICVMVGLQHILGF